MSIRPNNCLIRVWPDFDDSGSNASINTVVDDWNGGEFTLPIDHPIIGLAFSRDGADFVRLTLTNLSTKEIEWKIYSITQVGERAVVKCKSRRDHVRECVMSDEKVYEMFLNGLITIDFQES